MKTDGIPSVCPWELDDGKLIRHHRIPRNTLLVPSDGTGSGSSEMTPTISRLTGRRTSVKCQPSRDQPSTAEDNWRTSGPGLVTGSRTGDSISEDLFDIEETVIPFLSDEATIPNSLPILIKPSPRSIEEHNLVHLPYRGW